MNEQSLPRTEAPDQTHSAEYNRGWAAGNASALDACNPLIMDLGRRLEAMTAERDALAEDEHAAAEAEQERTVSLEGSLRAQLQPWRGYPVEDRSAAPRYWQSDPMGAYVEFEDVVSVVINYVRAALAQRDQPKDCVVCMFGHDEDYHDHHWHGASGPFVGPSHEPALAQRDREGTT